MRVSAKREDLLLVVISMLVALCLSVTAEASLKTSYTYYQKATNECVREVDAFLSSAEKRESYSAVQSVGSKCKGYLDSMLREIRNIGSNFRDSENRSWADRIKRDLLQSVDWAQRNALAVEKAGQNKTSSKQELEELKKALLKLGSDFEASHDKHYERLRMLASKVDVIGKKWREEFQDDAIGYDMANENFRKRLNEEAKISADLTKAMRESDAATEKFTGLRRNTTVTKNDVQSAANNMQRAHAATLNLRNALKSKENETKSAWDNVLKEWDTFVKEVKESTGLLEGDVAETIDRMGEFGKEFPNPFL